MASNVKLRSNRRRALAPSTRRFPGLSIRSARWRARALASPRGASLRPVRQSPAESMLRIYNALFCRSFSGSFGSRAAVARSAGPESADGDRARQAADRRGVRGPSRCSDVFSRVRLVLQGIDDNAAKPGAGSPERAGPRQPRPPWLGLEQLERGERPEQADTVPRWHTSVSRARVAHGVAHGMVLRGEIGERGGRRGRPAAGPVIIWYQDIGTYARNGHVSWQIGLDHHPLVPTRCAWARLRRGSGNAEIRVFSGRNLAQVWRGVFRYPRTDHPLARISGRPPSGRNAPQCYTFAASVNSAQAFAPAGFFATLAIRPPILGQKALEKQRFRRFFGRKSDAK